MGRLDATGRDGITVELRGAGLTTVLDATAGAMRTIGKLDSFEGVMLIVNLIGPPKKMFPMLLASPHAMRDGMVADFAIVPLEPNDALQAHALMNHPDIAPWLDHAPWELAERRASSLIRVYDCDSTHCFAAWLDSRLVGLCWLQTVARMRRRHVGEVWLAVTPDARGRGIGRGLLSQMVDTAERWLNLTRVQLTFFSAQAPGSDAAQKLLHGCGFAPEVVRHAVCTHADAPVHRVTWGRLRADTQVRAVAPPPAPPRQPSVSVSLRFPTLADATDIAALHRQESVMWGTLQLPSTSGAFWKYRLESNDPTRTVLLLAETAGKIVGLAGLHAGPPPRGTRTWTLGMGVHQDFQGAGVGNQLLQGIMKLAREWLALERLDLEVMVDNTRAIALYERHGFVREGVMRADVWRDGALVDTAVMAQRITRAITTD